MTAQTDRVVIVGAGVVGLATAYFLGKAGVQTTVIERDSIGSHASGFAYGGLSAVSGTGVEPALEALAFDGMRLHREFGSSLEEQTGIDTGYGDKALLSLAFYEKEAVAARAAVERQQRHQDYSVRWLDGPETRTLEPRISEEALGGVYVEGSTQVDPYRFNLALAQAAEKLGATIRHGSVTGLDRQGDRVAGVEIGDETIPCEYVVIAMGPWSAEAGEWLGFPVNVGPLKGQIIRLRAPGPPFECSLGWDGNYATTKPDGLVWAGTTEEEVGFDETPTVQARESITAALSRMVPSLKNAKLVRQTACLRPITPDRLPVLGPAPGVEGVFMATGAERNGILLGPSMGRVAADIIVTGTSDIAIDALSPDRFSGDNVG